MNNVNNVDLTICLARRPKTKAQAVTMELFGTMRRNEVELQEVMSVLEDAVKGFLIPLGRTLGFERDEIVKAFGKGLMNVELK